MATVLVSGAGGFIGSHLVYRLKQLGHFVRGVDLKHPEFETTKADEFQILDLRNLEEAKLAFRLGANHPSDRFDMVFNLAASIGGIGWISCHHAEDAASNSRINLNMLDAAVQYKARRFLYSSSACAYNTTKQLDSAVTALKESDAWPAQPEPGYGLEKLYAEELCRYYREDYGLQTQVVRFHNVAGPRGTWDGGKEKAPAAACRKVAMAKDGDEIEVWGDGQATRSFMFVTDCVEGLLRLWDNGYAEPINLGTSELISITDLYNLAIKISGKNLTLKYDTSKPQGVRGRNSDNTLIRQVLGWEPTTPIKEWLEPTYRWIADQVKSQAK